MVAALIEWRPVVGWEGRYEVSRCGLVRARPVAVACRMPNGRTATRTTTAHRLPQRPNRRGHMRVHLHAPDRRLHAYVHVLVAAAWIGPRPDDMLVCHRDDDKRHNNAENLYYGSRLDNAEDATRNQCWRKKRGKRRSGRGGLGGTWSRTSSRAQARPPTTRADMPQADDATYSAAGSIPDDAPF